MFDLAGKVIVVTGAAGNLGAAVAKGLLREGAQVALVERSEEKLRQHYGSETDSLLPVGGVDLTDAPAVEAAATRILGRFGRIDGLVTTVGGFRGGKSLIEAPLSDWDFLFQLNVKTAVLAARAVLPQMRRQRSGRIVTVGSMAALSAPADLAAYNASKSAVIVLTESLAKENRDTGINVNCVLPSTIDTPENRAAMPDADFSTWTPPEAIADAILFLLSGASRAITGVALPVTGRG